MARFSDNKAPLTQEADAPNREALQGVVTDERHLARARSLAQRLGLRVYSRRPHHPCLMLEVDERGTCLIDTDPTGPGPVRVDFVDPRLQHRLRQATPRREALARALGLVGNPGLEVLDATAGLGQDSFVLASLGARVTALETDPAVFALLHDGWARALADPATAAVADRLTPVHADAVGWLGGLAKAPRAVYLDPMYPTATKGGEVKKGMRSLQRLLGGNQPLEPLFDAAWDAVPERLVVKRPRRALALRADRRKFCVSGRHTRFDVYLVAEGRGD